MSEKKLLKEHGLKKGDALSAFSVQEGRRKMEELYHSSGFTKANVMIMEGEGPKDKGVVYEIHEGPLARISHVEFMGNKVASEARLKTLIHSTPGYFSYASKYLSSKFDRHKLEQDIETLTKYYRGLGYFSARIGRELVSDDSGAFVTIKFIVDEGPRYKIRSVAIEGSTKFEADKLIPFLKLQKGEYYNQDFMERDRSLLVDLYGTQGHAFADIQADPRLLEVPGELDLVFRISEGAVFHVGNINVHIAGEFPHTKETVILNRLSIRHGDLVDSREIRNSERRLKASQLFITNPQEGEPPRIVVREPAYTSVEGLADSPPRGSAIRGQSPEPFADQVERIAHEQREHEARYGKCIYSWNNLRPDVPALRQTQSYTRNR
jgi:outer membrane protein insertion porin family